MDLEERTDTIEVPKNTGVDGLIYTVKELLKRPRVQEIKISKGKVSYRQFVEKDAPLVNVGMDFGDLSPHGVIRNAEVVELLAEPGHNGATIIGYMMDLAVSEQFQPVAFVTGANSILSGWYHATTGITLRSVSVLFGCPLLTDRLIPDTALILCAGYGKDAALIDTQRAYKVEMELALVPPPETTVEVLDG